MTTREEIVALAKECGVTHRTWDYQDEQAVEAFYHAAQRQAYERAEHNNFMQRNNQVVALYDNPAPSVPEGYQLVPIEPTEAMQEAWDGESSLMGTWNAMLAAARSE
jgi:hypothetical protein